VFGSILLPGHGFLYEKSLAQTAWPYLLLRRFNQQLIVGCAPRSNSGYPLLDHPLPISAETLLFAGQHAGPIRVNICCVACQGWVGFSLFFPRESPRLNQPTFLSGNCSLWASFA